MRFLRGKRQSYVASWARVQLTFAEQQELSDRRSVEASRHVVESWMFVDALLNSDARIEVEECRKALRSMSRLREKKGGWKVSRRERGRARYKLYR